jgi:hypothetical protein
MSADHDRLDALRWVVEHGRRPLPRKAGPLAKPWPPRSANTPVGAPSVARGTKSMMHTTSNLGALSVQHPCIFVQNP